MTSGFPFSTEDQFFFLLGMNFFTQYVQDLSHTPGLGETSALILGDAAVVDFCNLPEAAFLQMLLKGAQQVPRVFTSLRCASVNFQESGNVRSHEPRPHRTLVISRVPLKPVALVASLVVWILRAQGPQPIWSQE